MNHCSFDNDDARSCKISRYPKKKRQDWVISEIMEFIYRNEEKGAECANLCEAAPDQGEGLCTQGNIQGNQ
jgi:hypothetical protein